MFKITLLKLRGEGAGAKRSPLPVFPLQLLQMWELVSKTFRLLVLTLFSALVYISKAIPSASPKLLNLNQDPPSKKMFFLVKSLQN